MKIKYITNARIPTEKAHGYQICKMCEEFSRAGVEVELIVPTRENFIKESAFDFYGLKENFKINYLKSFDFIKLDKIVGGPLACYLQEILFLIRLFFFRPSKDTIIYSRSPEIAWLFKLRGYKTAYEMHYWPETKQEMFLKMIKRVDKFVTITKKLKEILIENKIDKDKIIVAPDGVDLERFDIDINREEARQKTGLPIEKNIIMYTGHLYGWKGADILAKAAKEFNDDTVFVFVGGIDQDIKKFKDTYKRSNIIICGRKRHKEIPLYLKAADILVLPNIEEEKISSQYTSPLKMFEYMASKRPIVASDLPSIREILSEENAILVEPGDPNKLADGIKFTLDDPDAIEQKIDSAFVLAKKHDWTNRINIIIDFVL